MEPPDVHVQIGEFTLEVHYGGYFKEEYEDLLYVGGGTYLWHVDPDNLSGFEIVNDLQEKGYMNNSDQVLYRVPGKSLKDGLHELWRDNSVINLLGHLNERKNVELYIRQRYATEECDEVGQKMCEGDGHGILWEPSKKKGKAKGANEIVLTDEANAQQEDYESEDSDYLIGDESEDSNPELVQIREQVKITRKNREKKLKTLKLQNDLDAVRHEGRKDKQTIGTSYTAEEEKGNETDYPSSDDALSIGEDSDDEFNVVEDDGTVTEKEPRAYFRKSGTFPRYEPESESSTFSVGQLFDDRDQFKSALTLASVRTQRNLFLKKICKEYIRARCKVENCPWRISVGYMTNLAAYQVKTLVDKHTCSVTFRNKKINSTWLARHYMSTIRAMPTIKLNEFKRLVKEQLGAEVTRNQCRRAKEKMYDMLVGDSKAEYALMWDYATELRRSNKGSSIYMKVERPLPTDPPVFDRFYVCFEAVRKGFLGGCRKIIGVDGCFLKNVVKGQLLTAIGRDGNNQMFPLAWGVVQVENRDTWSWFLGLLKDDLNISAGLGWTFISDQQKGLVPAIADLLPHAEHRMCARHIYANWGGSHKGPKIQKQFWIIAKSTTEADFKENLKELQKMSPQAHDDMLQRPHPRHWCKAFFNTMVKCDIVDNNLCEAFNGKILEARCKTIYSMLEDIRKMVMERLHTQRASCQKWKKSFGPRIEKKLEENLSFSRYCHVCWNGEDGYEITAWGTKYVVDIRNLTCDCRVWQLTGIPCCHAICALLDKGFNPDDYVDSCYHKDKFEEAYSTMLQPVRDPKNWEKNDLIEQPIPPKLKIKRGRPKKQRKRTILETKTKEGGKVVMSRKGTTITCKLCKQPGHNRRGCPLGGKKATTSNPVTDSTSVAHPIATNSVGEGKNNRCKRRKTILPHAPSQPQSDLNVASRELTILNPGQVGELILGRERDQSRTKVNIHELLAKKRSEALAKRQSKLRAMSSQGSSTTAL